MHTGSQVLCFELTQVILNPHKALGRRPRYYTRFADRDSEVTRGREVSGLPIHIVSTGSTQGLKLRSFQH